MKLNIIKVVAIAAIATFFVSCGGKDHVVTVSNSLNIDRFHETVEINLDEISGVTAENVIVMEMDGKQIPSQVYTDKEGNTKLLFQANVPANGETTYKIAAGEREDFPTRAYSRYVPERLDDYAYENNLVAGRIYGPALEDPRTFGSDIWLKSTDRLVIDEWFKKNDYHHNYGEGMDCYKVGNTLGGGAIAAISKDGKIILGDNYESFEHICDGPIRTEAVFEYPAFDVDGRPVSATRVLSLDADSRFVKSTVTFHSEGEPVPVALASVKHDVKNIDKGANWVAYTEKASDTDDPDRDGDISVGLIYGCAEGDSLEVNEDLDGHAAIVNKAGKPGPITGWTGSGWSQGGVATPETWNAEVRDFALKVANPLVVKID